MNNYIIGLDIGTSGAKALGLTHQGQVLFTSYEAYAPLSGIPGRFELDPEVLLQAVVKALAGVLHLAGDEDQPVAVCFSCAMHSLIAVDASGSPLTNVITWADLRSGEQAERMKNTQIGKRIYERTGTPIHPMSPLCKIMWLKENMPEVFAKTEKFISIKEYIWYKMFGLYQVDYSIASATGLLDIFELSWCQDALQMAGIKESQLSELVAPTYARDGATCTYAPELKLPAEFRFVIGANDGCLANLGTNAVRPGDLAVTIGTSGAVRMISGRAQFDPQGRIFNYILTEHCYVSGGAINNGGVVLRWFVENFMEQPGLDPNDFSEIIKQADEVEPGSGGLVFLPYLFGERAPVWDADARGVFFGIRSGHGKKHFMRAVLEGITFSLYQIGLSLEETIGPSKVIYASGGFIRSHSWLQLLADTFGKPVCITNAADASALGAAILGLYATLSISRLEDAEQLIKVQKIYQPDMQRHKIYMRNFEIYDVLYGKLKEEFKKIKDVS